MTYKGINIINCRKDIEANDLLLYINAYYRVLPHDVLYKNILGISNVNIKNLSTTNLKVNLVEHKDSNVVENCEMKAVQFNYSRKYEAYGNINSCKWLAYLIISKSTYEYQMPVELIAAKIFYKKYFKDEQIEDVFKECCNYNDCKTDEVLKCCKENLKRIVPDPWEEMKKKQKQERKVVKVDPLLLALLQITK